MGKTKQKQFRTQQTLSGGTAPHRPGAPLATLTRFSLDGRFQPKHVHPGGRPQVSPHLLPTIRHKSSFQQSRLTEPAPDVFSHGELLPGALTTRRQGQSLLGPPPLGSSFRNLFTNPGAVHYLNSCGSLLTWGSASNTDEKKDSVQIIAGKCDEQTRKPNTDSGQGEGATNGQTHSVSEHPEPPFKQLCDNGLNEPGEESAERQTPQFQPTKTNAASSSDLEEKESSSAHLGEESVDQNRAAEVQGVGTSLKVTIQRSNESRAFNTSPEEMAAASAVHEKERGKHTDQFTCHICNSTCTGQHGFQTHMMSQDHQQRMMEIQRLGNNCLATFIPQSHESLPGTNREKTVNLQHWCPTCQCRFSGDVIEHRRTKKHKMAKVSSRPFCTLCDRHFRTPRKFVEHMKSPQHKQRVEEINHEGEVMDELITVDAIGCFEGEDDYEEDRNEERVPVVEKHSIQKEATMEETTDYDPDVQYGTSFVVPVAGFLCKLCHKFYHFESSARETHCRSLVHFQNLQKHNNLNMQKVETQGDGGRDV